MQTPCKLRMLLVQLCVICSYTMGMGVAICTPKAQGPHQGLQVRKTTYTHDITVMYHTAPPLANQTQLKPGSMQVCKPIVL